MINHTSDSLLSASAHSRKFRGHRWPAIAAVLLSLVAACQSPPPPPVRPAPAATPAPAIKTLTQVRFEPVAQAALPAIAEQDLVAAWPALLQSCRAFERGSNARRQSWAPTCAAAAAVPAGDVTAMRGFVTHQLDAFRVLSTTLEDSNTTATEARVIGTDTRGRITGYYEPLLSGSRSRTPPFVVPLHRVPNDLLTVDLASLHPELASLRLRGRLQQSEKSTRVVPYWSRAELNGERLRGAELLWVDDAIEAFFLQIQGSGRVRLPDGTMVRVGYADTNGHPYRSIGRVLIERGDLTFDQASMQGIQSWARANAARVTELLNQNPSYVFFRELPLGDPNAGPVGALSVPLTPGYSVAVDPRFIPLGAPLLIGTTHPQTNAPLLRLMLAQDTGGAIRGPLRFDLFWGFGAEAGAIAGRQRHDAEAWLLVPKGTRPESLLAGR